MAYKHLFGTTFFVEEELFSEDLGTAGRYDLVMELS